MLYSLDERSHFLNPISITQILNVLDEPGINLTDSFKCLMEADMLAMERLHNVITTKPKVCIAELLHFICHKLII